MVVGVHLLKISALYLSRFGCNDCMKVWRKCALTQLIRYVYKIVATETVTVIRQQTESSPIGNIIPDWGYKVGDNIPYWRLGINDSGKAESEKQSPILNRIKYHQMVILNTQCGILYPIGYFLLLVLYYNRHSYCHNHWSVTAFE